MGKNVVVFVVDSDEGMRLGITATKKIGPAVIRNRCKRRIRELFRLHQHEFGDLGADVVVNVRRGCAQVGWRDLEADFFGSLRRALGGY